MFAGRYIWWLVVSACLFFLALFAFDVVASIGVMISGCEMREGSCYILSGWLMDTVKPMLVLGAAVVLTLVVMIRIFYLRFFPFWAIPPVVWVAATGGALARFEPLWREGYEYGALPAALPPSAYAFIALAIFIAFPLEDEDEPQNGGAAPIGILAGFMAFMCVLHAFATSPGLPRHILNLTGSLDFATMVEGARHYLAIALLVADGNPIPGYLMTILFALALALRILRHERLVSGQL